MPWWWNTLKRISENPAPKRSLRKGLRFIVISSSIIWAGLGVIELHDLATGKTASLQQEVHSLQKKVDSLQREVYEKDFLLKDSQFHEGRFQKEQLKAIVEAEADETLLDKIPISQTDRDYFQKIHKDIPWTDHSMRRALLSIYKNGRKLGAPSQNANSYGIRIDEE